jgi:hypothetical protein
MLTEGSLDIDQENVSDQKIKTQPGKSSLAGEGLNVGRDEPVTYEYPGDLPWAFASSTIHRAVVDVAGKPWVGVEKEVVAAFAGD